MALDVGDGDRTRREIVARNAEPAHRSAAHWIRSANRLGSVLFGRFRLELVCELNWMRCGAARVKGEHCTADVEMLLFVWCVGACGSRATSVRVLSSPPLSSSLTFCLLFCASVLHIHYRIRRRRRAPSPNTTSNTSTNTHCTVQCSAVQCTYTNSSPLDSPLLRPALFFASRLTAARCVAFHFVPFHCTRFALESARSPLPVGHCPLSARSVPCRAVPCARRAPQTSTMYNA